MHGICASFHAETPAEGRNRSTECQKLMLEAGADFSLANLFDGTSWATGFQFSVLCCQEATLEHILKLGMPFVGPNAEFLDGSGYARSALSSLAKRCGYVTGEVMQIVDKAILLLKGKADITYQDADGDTVLHTILGCDRAHEQLFWPGHRKNYRMNRQVFFSLTEPKQLLIVCLSAGADVLAVNRKGETASSVAEQYGREDEWNEALTSCGYNHKEIWAHTKLDSFGRTGKRQSSQLSFEDVCRKRQEDFKFKERFFEERCRGCREPFHPSLISFEQRCQCCEQKFWYREEPLDSQYESLREQYLRDKDTLTQYWQRRQQSIDEKCLRFKRAFFEEHCRNCGFQFQPTPDFSPCRQCGARIRRRRGRVNACFKECLEVYRLETWRYKRTERWRDQILDGDDNPSDYSSDTDYGSDTGYHITSNEAGDIQINHSDFTTSNAGMVDSNLAEGPQTESNQKNSQAMDLDDFNMDTSLVDIANVAEAAAEEPLSPIPFFPANNEWFSFNNQVPADSSEFADFFDMYVEEWS